MTPFAEHPKSTYIEHPIPSAPVKVEKHLWNTLGLLPPVKLGTICGKSKVGFPG
jgi:hypothetical protein